MRVLISSCSSFWLSREAVLRARELDAVWAFTDQIAIKGEPDCWLTDERDHDELYSLPDQLPRHDPILLQVFDELGGDAMAGWDGEKIECVTVPDDLTYYIGSYIGEWVAEQHRVWYEDIGIEGKSAGEWGVFTKDSIFSPLPS